jgi:hypothetical protein
LKNHKEEQEKDEKQEQTEERPKQATKRRHNVNEAPQSTVRQEGRQGQEVKTMANSNPK